MELAFNRLLIFDGSHALHRAICEPHLWEMKNTYGERTGGIYGVLQTIIKESSTYNYFPVVVFDGHLSERRLSIYPNYKRHADKQLLLESEQLLTEAEILEQEHRREYNYQREVLKELLPAFGIPVIHLEDWEGDDIIYALTQITKDSIVVSDDKDLIQLVYESPERKCCVRRGMRNEFVDMNYLAEHEMNINEFVACKAVVGDTSDNIPSACYGVGEKTASGLLKLYEGCQKQNVQFPQTEEALADVCKKLNLSKRKAYLNFDENQFLTNVLLMDLSLVKDELSESILNQIKAEVYNNMSKLDVAKITSILDELEIRTVLINNLIDNRNKTECGVPIESYGKILFTEVQPQKFGQLF